MEVLDKVCAQLKLDQLNDFEPLKQVSVKIGVKPAHIGLGLSALLLIFVLMGYLVSWIAFLVGFLYPAYRSFKALESKGDDDDKQWLTYWVVFSSFSVFDKPINFIFSWVPFFSLAKIAFYVFLFHPETKGALLIYNKFLRGLLLKHQAQIDEKIQEVGGKVEAGVKQVAGKVVEEAAKRQIN
jgi:receptor expression-enhancing protein 5/6